MLSSKKSLDFFRIQFQLHFSQRATNRFFAVISLMFFSLSAEALTINVPEYDEDGAYTISWSGGRTYTQVRELKDGASLVISDQTSGSRSVTGKTPGVYTYTFRDCYVTGSQWGDTHTCSDTIYKTVYVTQAQTNIANKEVTPITTIYTLVI